MKYIKKYESGTKYPEDLKNWKVGNYIVCIDDNDDSLTYGKKYEILDIVHDGNKIYIGVDSDEFENDYFYAHQFVSEDQFREMKFNL